MYSLVRSQRATAHTLQNVSEVNRERSRLAAASSVCDSTKHNGLVTRGNRNVQQLRLTCWSAYLPKKIYQEDILKHTSAITFSSKWSSTILKFCVRFSSPLRNRMLPCGNNHCLFASFRCLLDWAIVDPIAVGQNKILRLILHEIVTVFVMWLFFGCPCVTRPFNVKTSWGK